jgi:hypothetical protein
MRLVRFTPLLLLPWFLAGAGPGDEGCLAQDARPAAGDVAFQTRELDRSLSVGYAVLPVDVNGDGKTDLVVVDTNRVVWFENPTWKMRTILKGMTRPDNVCVAAADIDGDGKIDLALGADWKPFNTKAGGTLHWLKQPASLDDPWKLYPIGEEPTVHRIRFADLGGGKPTLLVAPLMGRNSTPDRNWTDGRGVRLLAYTIPKDPTRDKWRAEVIDQSLHVLHNFCPVPAPGGKGSDILTASYEGVHRLRRTGGGWVKQKVGAGNQATPTRNRGASEVKQGKLKGGREVIATIEPWHGHQVVVYTPPRAGGTAPSPSSGRATTMLWDRHVLDEKLRWGHAVWFADLDGDGSDELIVGVRDNLSKKPGERCGVRIYKALDADGARWRRQLVDEGGVAVEDLACADLSGEGRIDIVAVGRATRNVRLYRNLGKK